MSSQLLLLLKFSLLALLYLFLLRVVRAVWAEVSTPAPGDAAPSSVGGVPASTSGVTSHGPVPAPGPGDAPGRGRGVPKSTPPTGAVAAVGTVSPPAVAPGRLVVVSPPELAGRSVEVGAGGVLVGRGPGCDLVVEDSYVSQRHLRVTDAQPDGWWVEDLGSTNGTFVDGERIVAPRRVGRGEPVSVGGVVVELQ